MAQSSQYGGRSDDLKDKATDQFKKVADRVEGVAGAAADQIREVGYRAGEVAGNFKTAVDKSVKQQPMVGVSGTEMLASACRVYPGYTNARAIEASSAEPGSCGSRWALTTAAWIEKGEPDNLRFESPEVALRRLHARLVHDRHEAIS